MKHYLQSEKEVISALETTENGLTSAEAERRLAENGRNRLAEGKKVGIVKRFFMQLADPMIIILIVAAVISAVIAVIEKETPTDVFIIMFVVILNAVLGVIQESKAEKAIEALKEMTAATSKVLRDGKMVTVKSEELVVGDVIILEAGDAVPADARIIESNSLKCEEAALTGESVPSEKHDVVLRAGENGDVPLGDRANMVYMGSTVVYGRGKAVITATGMETEMGKIATALSNVVEEKTPLQVKLSQLSKILTWLVLGICVFIFAFNVIRSGDFGIESLLDTFIVAVSLAVAAIPEGLAAVVTIVLSMGVTKMSKRSAVIRKLTAVETLGCTEVICSDKTGTLTQNKMTVTDFRSANKELLATAMTLCSDAEPDESGNAVGEPTECALVNFATKSGILKPEASEKQPRIGEAPFDSMRKMMTTVHKTSDGKIIQYTKGAPDELLRRCTKIITENGIEPLTDKKRAEILAQNKEMADKALRVLAAACRMHDSEPAEYTSEALERDLIFVGLCGMIDPVRPEVLDAIKACKTAGIRPIMITGDHKDTAVAIALELGIITDPSQAITGAELDSLSDEEFERAVDYYSVYARVQPEHKVKIVSAWKKRGKITAMTGDGVNDAPSIKTADIGIGMGITGTDVTKNVADMILADDNFATIVYAVEEGRKIYSNIRKAIQFLLSSNMSEVITIFTASIFGFTILRAPHLLWINLITDCFPALALGIEPGEKDVMHQKPRAKNEGIFAGGLGFDLVYQGILVTILTLAAYFIGYVTSGGELTIAALADASLFADAKACGITMAFLTMSMAEIFHSYNMRSQRHSIFTLGTHNFVLFGAMIAALALTTAVIEIPFLADMFDFAPLDFEHYAIALGLSIIVIPVVELVKLIQRTVAKKKAQ
ncbi:MAG: cation-translocating P-type ATPase [Eubacterium sp.]|nr:cation-translocating P-type ATPase [Eubacterium sp.]